MRIEKQIKELSLGTGSSGTGKKRWWNKSVMETISDVASGGAKIAGTIGRFGNRAVGQVFGNGLKLGGALTSGFGKQ